MYVCVCVCVCVRLCACLCVSSRLHEYKDAVKKIEQREEVVFYGVKNNIDRKLVIYGFNRLREWIREHRLEHIHSFFTGVRQFLWNTSKARLIDFCDPEHMIGSLLSDIGMCVCVCVNVCMCVCVFVCVNVARDLPVSRVL
jgi:hypothetical protein